MKANINEMIYALEKLNPAKLELVRNSNPDFEHLLQPGTTMGEDKSGISDASLKIKAEICTESNSTLIERCEKEFPKIKKRIINHKKLNLLSQILSTICSATIVTSLVAEYEKYKFVTIVFGVIGIIVSLMPVINDHLITGINNKKINESFEQLVKSKLEIEMWNKELLFFIKADSNGEKISEIINNCNAKTSEIMQLLLLS